MSARPRRMIMPGVVGLALLLALGGGVWVWSLWSQLGQVTRFDLDEAPGATSYQRPEPAPDGDSVTVLLAGVDNGTRTDLQDMLASGEWEPGAFRSDAIMVLHLPGGRERASLVSIPRDSWVPVDGYGDQKINAAFSFGGPTLLARTVEQVADVRLDHAMVVDWEGFTGITDVVGGVELGGELLGPDEALEYVRERKSLPNGDFDRVARQREYLLGLLSRLRQRDVVANPISMTQMVNSLDDFVAVDSSLTSRAMIDLGWSSRRLGPGDIDTLTAPNDGTRMVGAASTVRLDVPETQALFDRIVGLSR